MSKKFFRPPSNPYVDSEDEEEDEEALSDDEDGGRQTSEGAGKNNSSNNNSNANLSSDDDEEEEEAPKKGNKRKGSGGGGDQRKRPKATSFFELEAEASDEEEEEDYRGKGRGGARGGEDGERMDREALELIKLQDRRRAQAGGAFLERTAAEMARDIEERHRLQRRPVDRARIRPDARPPPPPRVSAAPAGGGGGSALTTSKGSGGGGSSSGGGGGRAAAAPARPASPEPMERHHHHEMADDEGGPEVYTAIAQQSLVPSVDDPSFWMVSCATGKETEMVLQLMNKAVAFARQNRPLGITGAIAAQSKGKIYIEAYTEPAVMEAIQNVRGLLQYTMRLVPIGDMTTVMTVTSKKKPVQKNEWVRLTRGHYKGDLALVKEVKDSGLRCIVQCVPRLDLTLGEMMGEEARVRRKTVRPPQKFFSPQELKAMGKHNILRQLFPGLNAYCYVYEGNYYEDGYLLKEMTVGSMVKPCTDEDPPTLDELQRFQRRKTGGGDNDEGADNEGSRIAASLLDELAELQTKTGFDKQSQKVGGLLIGDTIEVVEGDLIGVKGKIVSLDGSTVKVKPTSADVTEEIEFLASQVRKHIPEGTHVKVMDGRYANETGVVVAVEKLDGGGSSSNDYTAVILTDITSKEITVRLSQLRESAEVASGQDKLQGYELYDLVVLSGGGSANEVGVIVRVGREDFTVVNNHGIAREVRPEELLGKKNSMSNKAVALDVQGNQIRCGDTVNVVEGRHKGKAATIKRMNRSQLFLHSQTRSEHAGIFVVKSRSCVLAGSRTQSRPGAADGGQTPWTPQSSQASRGPGPGRKRDDGLIGKTVRIQAGTWKGFIGTVSDTTGTHVQVELHARLKKVMVTHERVHVIGDKFGATETQTSSSASVNPTIMAPTTPFVAAGQTPMHGGATPKHGGLDGEGGDEVWRPGGSIDQDNVDAAKENDGWGTSTNDQDGDDNDDWGSSANKPTEGEWGAPPQPPATDFGANSTFTATNVAVKEEPFSSSSGVAVKREQQMASEMEHDMPDNEERPGWLMERVCVTLKGHNDRQGSVKEIHSGKIVVELEDGSTESLGMHEISMVVPAEHDPVLVTGGDQVGLEGTLVCIDGTDAILKDANDAFKIVEFSFLAKIKA
ncbi:hypothetical protein ACA910_016999 [Epithemia clementina (nom. ined.)]